MIRSKVGLNVVVTGLGLGRLKALPFYNHLVCLADTLSSSQYIQLSVATFRKMLFKRGLEEIQSK